MTTPALPLFYQTPRPLSAERHGGLSLRTTPNYRFAARVNAVPLMAAEFATACRHVPILFTETELPQAIALLGLRTGENLLVDAQGAWADGAYIPAYIRRYPFIFAEDAERGEFTLCIDETADCVSPGGDNPFFVDGKPSAATESALAFAKDFQTQNVFTAEFAKAVAVSGILAERRADVTLESGERLSLAGFRVIDEARFNKLAAEDLLAWRERGWLGLVYAQLISIGTWSALIDRMGREIPGQT
jgi:hypothetical protein